MAARVSRGEEAWILIPDAGAGNGFLFAALHTFAARRCTMRVGPNAVNDRLATPAVSAEFSIGLLRVLARLRCRSRSCGWQRIVVPLRHRMDEQYSEIWTRSKSEKLSWLTSKVSVLVLLLFRPFAPRDSKSSLSPCCNDTFPCSPPSSAVGLFTLQRNV